MPGRTGKALPPKALSVLEASGFKAGYIDDDVGRDFRRKEGNPLPHRMNPEARELPSNPFQSFHFSAADSGKSTRTFGVCGRERHR